MATHQIEQVERQVEPDHGDPLLWHNAASWEDFCAALRGENYKAACGRVFKGQRGVVRHRGVTPAIEKCVVCSDVLGVKH